MRRAAGPSVAAVASLRLVMFGGSSLGSTYAPHMGVNRAVQHGCVNVDAGTVHQ